MKNFIARQPIFNKTEEVLGYEVLFRAGPENYFSYPGGDPSAVAVDNLLLFGVDRVASGKLAFINCSRDFLVRDYLTLLPKEMVVGEILETVSADADTIAACQRLKKAGYRLALDDYTDSPEVAPLVELADYIKVDVLKTSVAEQERLARELLRRKISLIAEKVETQEAVHRAASMGYEFFQGYFYCRPQMAERPAIPSQKLHYLRILQIANRPELDIDELAAAIKPEASLIYKLLRYLNSPIFALRTKVASISHALALLGEGGIRKWISLVSVGAMCEGKPSELIMVSLVRARFCELVAKVTELASRAGELFLMGALSVMDAILDIPMSSVLDEISVPPEVTAALLGGSGKFRDVFDIVSNYESGQWDTLVQAVNRARFKEELVPEFFLNSLDWANQVMSLA